MATATALEFTAASSEYASIAAPNAALNVQQITMSAWAWLDAGATASGFIFNRLMTQPGTYALNYYHGGGGAAMRWGAQVRLEGSEETYRDVLSDAVPAIDEWVHLLSTYDGSSLKLYVNNVLQADMDNTAGAIDQDNPGVLMMGAHPTPTQYWGGKFADSRVYNRALDTDERTAIYSDGGKGNDGVTSGLVGHWNFEEGVVGVEAAGANSVLDVSGYGSHATPVNTPVYAVGPAAARYLKGGCDAQSACTAALVRLRELSGAVNAQAVLVAVLRGGSVYFAGTMAGQGTLSAQLRLLRKIAGTCAATSALTGSLLDLTFLSGTIAATSGLTAAMSRLREIGGTIAAVSTLESPLRRIRRIPGTIAAVSAFSAPILVRFWIPYVEIPLAPPTGMRRLTWNTDEAVEIWLDGAFYADASGGMFTLPADTEIRQIIDVWDEPPNTIRTPLDRVALEWTGDATEYQVWRRLSGGDWAQIATVTNTTYTDDPLADGVYDYKIVAVDDEGDTATSATAQVTISSAPEAPSELTVEAEAV